MQARHTHDNYGDFDLRLYFAERYNQTPSKAGVYIDVEESKVPNDFVKELLHPSFISFLVKQLNTVLVIEDAEKVISNRKNIGQPSVVSTLLQLTDGLFSDYLNLKVICTFNTDISKIDEALFRKGRMIASYEFGKLAPEKVKALLGDKTAEQAVAPMTLAEIFHQQDEAFEQRGKRRIGFR